MRAVLLVVLVCSSHLLAAYGSLQNSKLSSLMERRRQRRHHHAVSDYNYAEYVNKLEELTSLVAGDEQALDKARVVMGELLADALLTKISGCEGPVNQEAVDLSNEAKKVLVAMGARQYPLDASVTRLNLAPEHFSPADRGLVFLNFIDAKLEDRGLTDTECMDVFGFAFSLVDLAGQAVNLKDLSHLDQDSSNWIGRRRMAAFQAVIVAVATAIFPTNLYARINDIFLRKLSPNSNKGASHRDHMYPHKPGALLQDPQDIAVIPQYTRDLSCLKMVSWVAEAYHCWGAISDTGRSSIMVGVAADSEGEIYWTHSGGSTGKEADIQTQLVDAHVWPGKKVPQYVPPPNSNQDMINLATGDISAWWRKQNIPGPLDDKLKAIRWKIVDDPRNGQDKLVMWEDQTGQVVERGNAIGNCAGSRLAHHILVTEKQKDRTRLNAPYNGRKISCMAEKWLSTGAVTSVLNAGGVDGTYQNLDTVPSCLTCSFFIQGLQGVQENLRFGKIDHD